MNFAFDDPIDSGRIQVEVRMMDHGLENIVVVPNSSADGFNLPYKWCIDHLGVRHGETPGSWQFVCYEGDATSVRFAFRDPKVAVEFKLRFG